MEAELKRRIVEEKSEWKQTLWFVVYITLYGWR